MSLIERALEKARTGEDAAKPRQARPARTSSRQARPASPPPADVYSRPVKRAVIDPERAESIGVLLQPNDEAAVRAYKILRTQLLRKLGDDPAQLVAVTAVNVGDGKTITALNLAISLARDVNARVALVDLDLQRPSIARYLGMQAEAGLDAYLMGQAGLDDIYYDIGVDRLVVVPTMRTVMHSSEALRSPTMLDFLEDLRKQQRIVVLDMPPLLMGDDVLAVAPNADGVLLVVGEGTTPRAALASARSVLADMNIIGVVLNRSAERDDTQYY